MQLTFDGALALPFVKEEALEAEMLRARRFREELLARGGADAPYKGWVCCEDAAVQLEEIRAKGAEINREADVFVLVGVGGSNQAARAVIEALKRPGAPEIIYAGNSLSADHMARVLAAVDGKSVFINVIAKNFETLEPGVHYRMLRHAMQRRYSREEMARRVVLTGTRNARLHEIAREHGHLFLEFPEAIGGRFSAFSPVGLLPIAAMGLDMDSYLAGAREMERLLRQGDEAALEYAAVRNLLLRQGFGVEMLAAFEPRLEYFARWWWQLLGESEGKDGTGILPTSAVYSEDLHSIGQYVQAGRRFLFETFLTVGDPGAPLPIPPDPGFGDRFDYLDGKDFAALGRAAEAATLEAHAAGGVPCLQIGVDRLDEAHLGMLYYFFMAGCAISGKLLGVNPFDQEGVEHYKRAMFRRLGKANGPA